MKILCLAALLAATGAFAQTTDSVAWLSETGGKFANLPFPEVIKSTTGHEVIPINPKRDAALIAGISQAVEKAILRLNDPAHPIHRIARVNEVSPRIEDEIRAELGKVPGWTCEVPKNASGERQRSGYPDLRLQVEDGSIVYLDPKLAAAHSMESTLRTFYYEPKKATNKVTADARHLLVGLRHNGKTGADLVITGWELVDLSKLHVRLKAEFQAANRDVYREESIVARGGK